MAILPTALNNPESIVLSRETAHTLFGQENPMGKVIDVNRQHNMTRDGCN